MGNVAKTSIIRKVVRRVVAVVLLTVMALSTVNLVYMTRKIRSEIESELDLVSLLSASRIDAWCGKLEGITEDLADAISSTEEINSLEIHRLLNTFAIQHGDLYFLYVATEEGDMYMARGVRYAEGVDPRKRVWYEKAKAAGHTIITDPYLSATKKEVMLVTAATPIFFGTRMVGVVGVDADIATINEYVSALAFKDRAYGFLIDSEGNIIAHKNEAFRPTAEKTTHISEAIPEIANVYSKLSRELVEGVDFQGMKMFYKTAPLSEAKWTVGLAYPSAYMYKTLDRGIRICIVMAVFSLIIAISVIATTVKKILAPIEKMNPVLDGIMRGDFSVEVEWTKEEDELGLLQQKMVAIVKRLEAIIREQKYVLGEMEKGNLIVEDIEPLPGDLNGISTSVNSIKEAFNDIISDIQFSAINLQSFAMGVNETSNLEEMKMIFEELSAEANILMEKTSKFTTMPDGPKSVEPTKNENISDYLDDF